MSLNIEQITKLYTDGLYSSINLLASFLLSHEDFSANSISAEYQRVSTRLQMIMCYAESLFTDEQYTRAEHFFSEALSIRKNLNRMNAKGSQRKAASLPSEVDIKYHMYECYMKSRDFRKAITILEGISLKQRSVKINMALGKLYHRNDMERTAVTCYKEVLRCNPLALDAAIGLIELGTPLQEVQTLVAIPNMPDWISILLKASSLATTHKYSKSIQLCKQMESQTFRDSIGLSVNLADLYWKNGDKSSAKFYFEKVRALDKSCLEGMGYYAQLLAEDQEAQNLEVLEKLSLDLNQISSPGKTEPWIAIAHYCSATNRKTKAVYFAQKAHLLDIRNVQALLLKANLLQSLNKYQEAMTHYRESMRISPNLLEPYKGLVECHLAGDRQKEAMVIARNALKTIGTNANTLQLCAEVYLQDLQTQDKAKAVLEKALTCDPLNLAVTYQLVGLYMQDEDYQSAIQLIQKQLEVQKSSKLHRLLGDCLKATGLAKEAMQQYGKSIRLTPNDAKTISAMNLIERESLGESHSMSQSSLRRDSSNLEELVSDADLSQDLPWLQ